MTRRILSMAILAALVAVGGLAGPATASSPVDPNTLNPPPPDFFNAQCQRTVKLIVCTLHFDTVDDVFDEPSGIVCGGTELTFSQVRAVVGKRYYNADGDLLIRHFQETLSGDFTNPATGKVATWRQHDDVFHRLGTPGVIASGFTTFAGVFAHVRGPNGRTILVDAGIHVIDEATGELVFWRGPHHFDDYFVRGDTHALDPICDALD